MIPTLSFAAPVQDCAQTAIVSFHTATHTLPSTFLPLTCHSQEFEASSECHSAGSAAIYSMLDFCVSSEARVMAESDKTAAASQKVFEELMKRLQSIAQENLELRKQLVESNSKLVQMTEANQAQIHALKNQMELAKTQAAAKQKKLDQTMRESGEKVALGKRETHESLTKVHQTQIAALNLLHATKAKTLQSQLQQATTNHQTAVIERVLATKKATDLAAQLTLANKKATDLATQLNQTQLSLQNTSQSLATTKSQLQNVSNELASEREKHAHMLFVGYNEE